ncbi:MAG: glutathione S-transferase family protein [Alphaproteobacteria bacterium]|nr:glutathione S-transferase family protein [Alphaproteobacteria bacterium]
MYIVWEHPLSPYVQKVKIALREKGLPFEARMPDGIGAGGAEGAFSRASPLQEVPALIDGEFALFESGVMLEYLEDKHPEPRLIPADPKAAARGRMIARIMDTQYEAINWAVGEIKYFRRAEGDRAAALLAEAARQTAQLNGWLSRRLEGPWFCGEAFGYADLSVLPCVASAAADGRAPEGALAAWLERASARDSVRQTLEESRAAFAGFELAHAAIQSGLFKRQYRDHRLEWMMRSGGAEIVREGVNAGNIRFSTELS